MEPRTTTWEHVTVGKYIQDTTGKTWRVEDMRDGKVLLQDAEQKRQVIDRPVNRRPVTVVEPTHDEALALVQENLGAVIVRQRIAANHPWICPPLRHDLSDIHHHMFQMHGVYTRAGAESKSKDKLLERHREDHLSDPHASHAWVEHRHQ